MKYLLLFISILCISITPSLAQDKGKETHENAPKSDVYIDGKKYDHDIIELLDNSKIESVDVIKGEKAIDKYNSPNGVIMIKTKNAPQQIVTIDEAEIKLTDKENQPMIIVDGEVKEKGSLDELSPDSIESIEVVKGQKAIDKYDAPNGVILVKTKKRSKN